MRRHILAVGLIIGAIFAAYSNALRNGFIGDDRVYVESNPFVQDPANLKVLIDPRYYLGSHELLAGSRPVFLATLMADRALWGKKAAGFHATNVILHGVNSVWVYALSSALGLPPPLGLWAGLFFGLHPVQTEAVNVVSFRPDLLAAFFFFFSLWVYLQTRGRRPKLALPLLAASAGLFGFGLLSKEMAATLPAVVLLVELYFPCKEGRRLRLACSLAAFSLVACLFAGFWSARFRYSGWEAASPLRSAVDRFASAMPTAPGTGTLRLGLEKGRFFPPSAPPWRRLFADPRARALTMIKALAGYLRLLLVADPLVSDRAPEIVRDWRQGGIIPCLACLLLAALYAVLFRKRDPPSAFGAAWCLATLIPVSNLIPLHNPVAERYLYLIAAGAAWAAASAIAALARLRAPRAGQAAALMGCLLACAYGIKTRARNADWQSERTLYLGGKAKAPQNSAARLSRASLLQEDGRWTEARREYEEAIRSSPDDAEAWLGLGATHAALGNIPQAAACHEKAISASPRNPILRFAYALFLAGIGQKARAADMYREALELEPAYVEAWVNLGALHRDTGRYQEARSCYEKAVSLAAPNDPMPFYSFATLLEKTGDIRGASLQYHAALERNASYQPARQRLASLQKRARRSGN